MLEGGWYGGRQGDRIPTFVASASRGNPSAVQYVGSSIALGSARGGARGRLRTFVGAQGTLHYADPPQLPSRGRSRWGGRSARGMRGTIAVGRRLGESQRGARGWGSRAASTDFGKRSRASVLIAPSPQKFLIVHVGLQGFHISGGGLFLMFPCFPSLFGLSRRLVPTHSTLSRC